MFQACVWVNKSYAFQGNKNQTNNYTKEDLIEMDSNAMKKKVMNNYQV